MWVGKEENVGAALETMLEQEIQVKVLNHHVLKCEK